jgi:lysozyme
MRDRLLRVGPDGQTLGHYYEGLENAAYPDPATGGEPWTCGIGCTGTDSKGAPITSDTYWEDDEALHEYGWRMDNEFAPGVKDAVTAPMNQKEFDAMVDLAYNIGVGAFAGSTLVRKFNAGDKQGAADQFPEWNMADGEVMKGLQRRRWAERHVFLGGTAEDGIDEAEEKYP